MAWYEDWFSSPYYKILYGNHNKEEAKDIIERLLQHLQPAAGSKMLDIACGEGRFAIALAKHPYSVTGIDLSANSIEQAKKSETGNLQFFVHDMRYPIHKEHFHYAFNFFTSFGYFKQEEDNYIAAKAFADSLVKGGVLVLDYFNAAYITQKLQPRYTIEIDDVTFNILKKIDGNFIIKEIAVTDKNNNVEHTFKERVALFSLSIFNDIFVSAGFELQRVFGNYMFDFYDENTSPRLIMIFKKK